MYAANSRGRRWAVAPRPHIFTFQFAFGSTKSQPCATKLLHGTWTYNRKKTKHKKRCMVILFGALVTASATTCESERRWPSQSFTWNPKFCAKPVFVVLAVFVCLNSELGCKPGVRDRPFRTFPSWESFCLACYLRQGTPCPRGNAKSLSRTWWNFNRGTLKPYQPLPCCSRGTLVPYIGLLSSLAG